MKGSTGFIIFLMEYMKRLGARLIFFLIVIIAVLTRRRTVPLSKNANMTISREEISLKTTDSSSTPRKEINNFSRKGITFNYPCNWMELPNFINQIISGDLHAIGVLDGPDSDAHLVIQKYSLSYLGVNSVEEYQTMENRKQLNSSILMENTTTVNDLTIYETITYDHNPDFTTQKTLSVTAGKGQNVYILQFYSNPELFDRYLPVFNKIVSTMQIQ